METCNFTFLYIEDIWIIYKPVIFPSSYCKKLATGKDNINWNDIKGMMWRIVYEDGHGFVRLQ
jgi:hypothetical protein